MSGRILYREDEDGSNRPLGRGRGRERDRGGSWRDRRSNSSSYPDRRSQSEKFNRGNSQNRNNGRNNPFIDRNDRRDQYDSQNKNHIRNNQFTDRPNDRRDQYDSQNKNHIRNNQFTDRPNDRRDQYDSQNRDRRNNGPRTMGYPGLKSLLELDDIEAIILIISDSKKGFTKLLESESIKPDVVVFIVRVLNKIAESSTKRQLIKYMTIRSFVKQLTNYIVTIENQDNKDKRFNDEFWKESDRFWQEVTAVCRVLFEISPSTACDVTPKLLKTLKKSIPRVEEEHKIHISDLIKTNVEKLSDTIEEQIKEIESKKQVKELLKADPNYEEEYVPPPDDYRDINVYPSGEEITNNRRTFFLNKNRSVGKYESVSEYLDVHFRLLREDFVAPLREAVCSYLEQKGEKITTVKFYQNVQFLNMESVNEAQCFRLQFDFQTGKQKRKVNYAQSKRFMFGSLLCFTQDNFKTVLFGKVAQRDIKDLDKGQLIVGMESGVPKYNHPYLMLECAVYFEPYYQVLTVLKQMDIDDFPMKRYLVDVESDVRMPKYLMDDEVPIYYTINNKQFWPFNFPEQNFYDLNESQLKAFKAALTKELAIIQGPPGTGKTHLGLKIAHTLLNNHHAWYKRSPILLICYTNHALDQFLEGIVPCTQQILRIGGQSKNEALNEFNIRKKKRPLPAAVGQIRRVVSDIVREIKQNNHLLEEVESFHYVMSFEHFAHIIPNYELSWFARASNDDLRGWLMAAKPALHVQEQEISQRDPETEPALDDEEVVEEIVDNNNEENNVMDDIFDEDFKVADSKPLIDLKQFCDTIRNWKLHFESVCKDENNDDPKVIDEIIRLNYEIQEMTNDYNFLQEKLTWGSQQNFNVKKPKECDFYQPDEMPPNMRWKLYFLWVQEFRSKLINNKNRLSELYRKNYREYNELRSIEDAQIMKEQLVIGMTTTGAARMNSALQALKCPIVIVEEAAEVLEAHIVSALTRHCQHLILIGDHQQLKPSTADFKMETTFKLGISLFERMINNKIECHTLNVQHRMRPEISALVAPTIYPDLVNHVSVENRPPIDGIEKNLFFIDHRHPESQCDDSSKKNKHEAEFVVDLARHLILNGYEAKQITILAAYLGQMFEIIKLKKSDALLLSEVRVAVLDNYQGEECDIILLSLVRSNTAKSVGFLKIENRVCVALSRARNGLYIIGNMELLAANSEIWPKVKETLVNQQAIGESLPLVCQVHPYKKTFVKCREDFLKVREGGCDLQCNGSLPCGHICKMLCHVQDRDHAKSRCLEPCTKLLCDSNPFHKCRQECYRDCGPCTYRVLRDLDCGHQVSLECHIDHTNYKCREPVKTKLPCGHEADKPCHMDVDNFRCPLPCDVRVEPCGHACMKKCHVKYDPDHLEYQCRQPCPKFRKDCTTKADHHRCRKLCFEECEPCLLEVQKSRTVCPHFYRVACNYDVDQIVCEKPCTKTVQCGHKCKNKCWEPCGLCTYKVDKVVPDCGHKIKVACHEEAVRKFCLGKCPRQLPCGHTCTKRCKEPCTTECKEIVACEVNSPCGHVIKQMPCYINTKVTRGSTDVDLLDFCKVPCGATLKCDHKCLGSCGACYQGRIHAKCAEKCGVPLVCNHECTVPCRQACKPCQKKCIYRCPHSKCSRKCGEVCTPCAHRCDRKCKHQQCTKNCGEICSVPPCEEPCDKRLKCGHPCVGFCGDPCPTLCRICDQEELTEILFGDEDEPDARFVQLKDCGHVLESEGLNRWFMKTDSEIQVKACPKCKSPVIKTLRFSDYLKQAMLDVEKVKSKVNGTKDDNETKTLELFSLLSNLYLKVEERTPLIKPFMQALLKRITPNEKSRNRPLASELNAIQAKIQILEHIVILCQVEGDERDVLRQIFGQARVNNKSYLSEDKWVINQVKMIIKVLENDQDDRISNQEIEDINQELTRLQRIMQFERIIASPHYASVKTKVAVHVRIIENSLFRKVRYSSVLDDRIMDYLKELNKQVASNVEITDAERRSIVEAMGMTRGHWFKCPNGHVYAIGDCGGAMVESKCNECGATIGGGSHRLRDDNTFAPEMDGAAQPAWSNTTDLRNYDLNFF
ncbi:unnamed protein product [Brassicogethes aeneus]|uniref:RZ-type domain-containing protein n=1 Tax=Brassicogethes aeneus TaxID=1431903 RepID=A0A9P0FDB6_BRAAE|nr:unnamed protein product [Brassicogethes aeneus]